MAKCAFFGHSKWYYSRFKEKLKSIIIDLIENKCVTEFYNGCRGDFDNLCIEVVHELKERYPHIKLILVLSYYPDGEFFLPRRFDETVYLLEKSVPPRFAIYHTNRRLVEIADYIISGVHYFGGGEFQACNYAKRLKKEVIEVENGDLKIFSYNLELYYLSVLLYNCTENR